MSGALREAVAQARGTRCAIAAAEAGEPPTLAGAYAIQAELFGERRLVGYKLGVVSAAKQQQMGLDAPVYGRVADDMLLSSPVDLDRFVQPRMEPELAVTLRAPIAPGATRGAVQRAIGATTLAVDILDSIWSEYRFTLPLVVADNASGGGFLLGERALPFPDEGGELRLLLDGEPLGAGPIAALGDVTGNLAWLASETGRLAAGAVVFCGSPAAAVPARPGLLELHGPRDSVLLARLAGDRHDA